MSLAQSLLVAQYYSICHLDNETQCCTFVLALTHISLNVTPVYAADHLWFSLLILQFPLPWPKVCTCLREFYDLNDGELICKTCLILAGSCGCACRACLWGWCSIKNNNRLSCHLTFSFKNLSIPIAWKKSLWNNNWHMNS